MPLKRIARLFPEVVHTATTTLVDRPGWLLAQRCEAWWRDDLEADPVSVLFVYRSPLVTQHKRMYRPVSELILAANRFEVLANGTRQDSKMMHGDKGAEFLLARMTQANEFPPGPLDFGSLKDMIAEAIEGALTQKMEVA
ncbi:hypothetical protein SEA_SUPERCHUNK_77 [Mycobacterium phage Superchunk]|nr:hypothetical protein SEA_SUPERCHUNK_77 [Mycobacterium phage Superchunk]